MGTWGQSGAPNSDTIYLDHLLSSSLFSYQAGLVDQVLSTNVFWNELKGRMKSKNGGIAVKQRLRYAINKPQLYDGYDPIVLMPTDGVTQATFEWRQAADTVMISKKEEVQNADGMGDVLEDKIQMLEDGFKEWFDTWLLQGNYAEDSSSATNFHTPAVNLANSASFVDPLPLFVKYDPTSSTTVGGINQSTYSWWQNRYMEATATTPETFLNNMDHMYNTCSIGVGGAPNIILVDQVTYELWRTAYYRVYRSSPESGGNYPFPNFKFNDARVVWSPKIPNIYSGNLTTGTGGYGTAYFLNMQFYNGYYIGSQNFVNEPFQKPANQNIKTSLVLWMGTVTVSNRKKHGVVGKIPRTLS